MKKAKKLLYVVSVCVAMLHSACTSMSHTAHTDITHLDKGYAYLAQEKYKEAIEDYTNAIRYTTDNERKAEMMEQRSTACEILKRKDEAQYKTVQCHLHE